MQFFTPTRLTRYFTFAWCLSILYGIQLFIINAFIIRDLDYVESIVFGSIIGTIIAYIPLVFLGIGFSVILESVVANQNIKGLSIVEDTWHGPKGIISSILNIDRSGSICGHCWCVPIKGLFCLFILPIVLSMGTAVYVVSCLSKLSLFVILLPIVIFSEYRYPSWLVAWEYVINFGTDVNDILQKRNTQPKINYQPSIISRLVNKIWDVIKALKQRACPTIQWQSVKESVCKYGKNYTKIDKKLYNKHKN